MFQELFQFAWAVVSTISIYFASDHPQRQRLTFKVVGQGGDKCFRDMPLSLGVGHSCFGLLVL